MNAQLYNRVSKATTHYEKKKRSIKSSGKFKFIMIMIGAALASSLFFWTFYNLSKFYDKYQIKFQTPIIIRPPFTISERKPKIIEKIKVVKTSRTIEKSTLVPFKKYLTEEGMKTRERSLTYLRKYYQGDELIAMDNLLKKEAGYRLDAINDIGACGIGQAYPCEKMTCPLNDKGLECQLQWVIGYVIRRYGSPTIAWDFHLANNWY